MKKTLLVTVLLLAGIGPAARGQDEDWRKVRAQIKARLNTPDPGTRLLSVEKLVNYGNRESLELMFDFWAVSTLRLQQLRVERIKKQEMLDHSEVARGLKQGITLFVVDAIDEYKKLQAEVKELGHRISMEQVIQMLLADAMSGIQDEKAILLLYPKLRSREWSLRAAVAEALGKIGTDRAGSELLKTLKRERDERVQLSIVDALSRIGGEEMLKTILDLLKKTGSWQVKVSCAQGLSRFPGAAPVRALVEALQEADGRLREEINKVLMELTGVDKHGAYEPWKNWLAQNEEALAAGTYEKPPVVAGEGKAKETMFYGIPVVSKRVIFILDRSGSMEEPTLWSPPDGVESP